MTITTAPSTGNLTHRQIVTILSGLMLGMFLASLDQTIVTTAMRTIADKLNGQTAQAWVTTAYLVTSTVTTPLYGKLSDMYGRKPFYLFAIGSFVVGSVLCGQAHSIYELAAYRAVQGLGAGGLLSLALAIVGDIVPPRERARYQAYLTSVFALSSVLGPVAGGFFAGQDQLLGTDGWRWIFYINVPIGALALLVVQRNLRLPRYREQRRIDFLGAGLLTVATVPLLLVAEKGREWGWGSGLTLGMLALAVVGLLAFVPRERALGEDAIVPLRIFQNGAFSVTSLVAFLMGMIMFGGLALLPLYLQIVKQMSPTRAGLTMIAFMVGMMLMSQISGRLIQRTGRYRRFPIIGTAVMFFAVMLFSTLTVDTPVPLVMAYMVLMGCGLGLTMQTLVVAAQNALPPKDMGLSTSTFTFFRSMGATLGAAVSLGVLFGGLRGHILQRATEAHFPAPALHAIRTVSLDNTSKFAGLPGDVRHVILTGFADSMHTVFLVVAVVSVVAFVATLFIREVPLRHQSALASLRDAKAQGDMAMSETAIV